MANRIAASYLCQSGRLSLRHAQVAKSCFYIYNYVSRLITRHCLKKLYYLSLLPVKSSLLLYLVGEEARHFIEQLGYWRYA